MEVFIFALLPLMINNIIIITRSITMAMAALMPAMIPPLISEVLELLFEVLGCSVVVNTSSVVNDDPIIIICTNIDISIYGLVGC